MRNKRDAYKEFQQVHSLRELDGYGDKKYLGAHIKFLEMLFGEDWQEIFDGAYGDDVRDFMNDYGIEYSEWLEFIE